MIEPKLKICAGCEKPKYIWKSQGKQKFCKECWYFNKDNIPKRPAKVSPKKKIEMDEYTKKRIAFLALYPICKANLVGCTKVSTDVHHKEGRVGENYLKVSTWLSCCRSCHQWVEDHPIEAKELGLSDLRLK